MSKSMKNNFSNFISGRGFYVALAVCLVGAGSAAWVAADRTISNIENQVLPAPVEEKMEVPKTDPADKQETPQVDSKKEVPKQEKSQNQSSSQQGSSTQPKPSAKSSTSQSSSTPQVKSVTSSFALPIKGEILGKFSNGELVKNETLQEWRTHNGIDIKCGKGEAVKSATDAKVSGVQMDEMWGMIIETETEDGYTITYYGLDKNKEIKPGDMIKKGDGIGVIGEIKCEQTMGPHLHLEIKQKDKYIDPLTLMK